MSLSDARPSAEAGHQPCSKSGMKQMRDLLGVAMVGDGLLMALVPERRMRRWQMGPDWFRSVVTYFEGRTALTRLAGAVTAAVGVAIAVPRSR
jgi:hypothetical protein